MIFKCLRTGEEIKKEQVFEFCAKERKCRDYRLFKNEQSAVIHFIRYAKIPKKCDG